MNNFCSSCGWAWGGCGCTNPSCNYIVVNQSGDGSTGLLNAVNANIAGIGVLDAVDAQTAYFRGIESASAAVLSVALNATNHTIVLTLNVNALAAALPQATTTQAGVGETATDAEAQAKASTTVFVTPSNFAAMGSSTTFAGLTEYATDAEAIAGVSTTLALTPANLAAAIAANYGTTVTFADQVARNAAVPAFIGQFGAEVDTQAGYIGSALVAGSWNPLITGGVFTDIGTGTTTTVGMGPGSTFSFSGDPTDTVEMRGVALSLIIGGYLEMDNSAGFSFSNVITNNAFISNNGFGVGAAVLINTVLTTQNIDTGWTGFTNSAVRKTGDCNTITLAQLAQVVDTLINDLKSVLLPAT